MSPAAKPGLGVRFAPAVATLRHYHEMAGRRADRPPLLRHERLRRRAHRRWACWRAATSGGVDSPRAIVTVDASPRPSAWASPGFYGSYLVERAERGRAMRELEESTLSSLEDTDIARGLPLRHRRHRARRRRLAASCGAIVMTAVLLRGRHHACTPPTCSAVAVGLHRALPARRLPRLRVARAAVALRRSSSSLAGVVRSAQPAARAGWA